MLTVASHPGRGLRAWLLAAMATAAAVFAFALWAAPPASAYFDDFCNGAFVGAHDSCYGPDHTLTATQAYDVYGSDPVCAGANYNGELFVGYDCGNGFAEKCYSGTHALKPKIHNQAGFAQTMRGRSFFGENCP
jgi:hypothetical protein